MRHYCAIRTSPAQNRALLDDRPPARFVRHAARFPGGLPRCALLSRWVGVRLPDGSVEFADADLVITGRIDGDMERIVARAPEPVRGRFERDHDGQQSFVLEGALRGTDVRLDLVARFLQVGGTPTATVTTSSSCSSGACVHTHSATGSLTFDGRAVGTYRWFDSAGRLIGTTDTYRSRADTSYPLMVRVEDSSGRFATQQVRRPLVVVPRDLPFTIPFR